MKIYATCLKYIFYVYLYTLRFLYLVGIYKPAIKESMIDKESGFMNTKQKWFMEKIEKIKEKANANIDPVFYKKTEYEEYLKTSTGDKTELEKKWENRKVFICTPRGNVCMYYDAYKMGFAYYCDQSNLGMNTLNACAMQYVIYNLCLDFYVDEDTSVNFSTNEIVKIHYGNDTQAHPPIKVNKPQMNDMYVKPKSATMVATSNLKQKLKKGEKPKLCNKYIYMGKINKVKTLQIPEKKPPGFFSVILEDIKTQSMESTNTYAYYKEQRLKKLQETTSQILK